MALSRGKRIQIISQVIKKALASDLVSSEIGPAEIAELIVDKVHLSKYLDTSSFSYGEGDMVKVVERKKSGRRIVRFNKKVNAKPL